MPPPNTIPWHIKYFKLKEYEKWYVKEGLPVPEAGHKTLMSSLDLEERNIFISKIQQHQEESEQKGLVTFPPAYYTYLIPFVLLHLSTTFHFSSDLA